MLLHEKITNETDDNDLRELLGTVIYSNINNLYNRLKNDEIHHLFYKDYLTGKNPDRWFVRELLKNEDHIDFNEPINDSDYDQLLSDINIGYSADYDL